MSIVIRRLNDQQRLEVARNFTPSVGRIHGSGDNVTLTKAQRDAITESLQGCLLALAFTDNRYDYPAQVAYMAECIATFHPKLKELNTYDTVYCPVIEMIKAVEKEVL